jgi:small subunit ribosomal protein S17
MSDVVQTAGASGQGRELSGRVVSNKMDKTVTVEVSRTVLHPRYHKFITRSARYKAHDETNACKEGDFVVIRESRPLSKGKRWTVVGQNG